MCQMVSRWTSFRLAEDQQIQREPIPKINRTMLPRSKGMPTGMPTPCIDALRPLVQFAPTYPLQPLGKSPLVSIHHNPGMPIVRH
jgi:hypothetical protein